MHNACHSTCKFDEPRDNGCNHVRKNMHTSKRMHDLHCLFSCHTKTYSILHKHLQKYNRRDDFLCRHTSKPATFELVTEAAQLSSGQEGGQPSLRWMDKWRKSRQPRCPGEQYTLSPPSPWQQAHDKELKQREQSSLTVYEVEVIPAFNRRGYNVSFIFVQLHSSPRWSLLASVFKAFGASARGLRKTLPVVLFGFNYVNFLSVFVWQMAPRPFQFVLLLKTVHSVSLFGGYMFYITWILLPSSFFLTFVSDTERSTLTPGQGSHFRPEGGAVSPTSCFYTPPPKVREMLMTAKSERIVWQLIFFIKTLSMVNFSLGV